MVHRHPDFWENPEEFDPDRFEASKLQTMPKFAFFPFAGGGHRCIAELLFLRNVKESGYD